MTAPLRACPHQRDLVMVKRALYALVAFVGLLIVAAFLVLLYHIPTAATGRPRQACQPPAAVPTVTAAPSSEHCDHAVVVWQPAHTNPQPPPKS